MKKLFLFATTITALLLSSCESPAVDDLVDSDKLEISYEIYQDSALGALYQDSNLIKVNDTISFFIGSAQIDLIDSLLITITNADRSEVVDGIVRLADSSAVVKTEVANETFFGAYVVEASSNYSLTVTPIPLDTTSIAASKTVVIEAGFAPLLDTIAVTNSNNSPRSGEKISLTASLKEGSEVLNYQWYKDGVIIPTATVAALIIESCTSKEIGAYFCKISNKWGEVTSEEYALTVADVNRAPVWDANIFTNNAFIIPSIKEGDTLKFNYKGLATDPDGDVVTLTLLIPDSLKDKLIPVGDSAISFIAGFDSEGVYGFEIEASDTLLKTVATFTFSVSNENQLPVWNSGIDTVLVVAEGDSLFVDLDTLVTDLDGDKLTFTVSSDDVSFDSFDTTTSILSLRPLFSDAAEYSVTVTADDGKIQIEQTIVVKIININRAPQINAPLEGASVEIHKTLTKTLDITDPDGDVLTVEVLEPAGLTVDFDQANKEISFFADRAKYAPLDFLQLKLRISDGIDFADIVWEINTLKHTWGVISNIPNSSLELEALNSEEVFVLTESGTHDIITKYVISGVNSASSFSSWSLAEEAGLRTGKINLSENNLYYSYTLGFQVEPSGYSYTLTNSSLSEVGSQASYGGAAGGLRVCPVKGTDNIVTASVGSSLLLKDTETSTEINLNGGASVGAFGCSAKGANIIYAENVPFVYRRLNNTWVKIKEPGPTYSSVFTDIEMASDYGDTVYLIDNNLDLYKTTNGRAAFDINDCVIGSTGDKKTKAIKSVSGNVLWRIDGNNMLRFSNDGFETENYTNFGTNSISKLIVSYDRKAIFVVDNSGVVYRY
jgi:hypothetical protein